MIEFRNVSFSYPDSPDSGLHNIDLTILDGQCILLCGRSGCGKTTLTRLVNSLIVNHALQRKSEKTTSRKFAGDTAVVERVLEFIKGIAEVKSYSLTGRYNRKLEAAIGSLHAFYPTACVSTHAVVLCDMNGRQMPLSPAPTSSSVPLGLIRRGYVSHKYIGPSVTP